MSRYPETLGDASRKFFDFCNTMQNSGYVKPWKANGIVAAFWDMLIFDDRKGSDYQRYMRSCLMMEGFREGFCDKIALELKELLETQFEAELAAERTEWKKRAI